MVHREHAMSAGKLATCIPATEVEAQLFGGRIEGSFLTFLDFDYDNEIDLKRWDGISSYHDFELHEDGEIAAWKSWGSCRGKRPQRLIWISFTKLRRCLQRKARQRARMNTAPPRR
jgi:hypothetical protein